MSTPLVVVVILDYFLACCRFQKANRYPSHQQLDNYSFHIHIETTYYSTNTMAGKEGMFGVEELTSAKSFS
jgi:hypothetical protein